MADAATISVLLSARDEASAKLRQVEGRMGRLGETFARHRVGIGRAATGIGAAITGMGLLAVKSSLDQQKGIDALDIALKNIGTSYEENKAQIEALASAQQAKTNFGDEEQRKALQGLVQVTGDYSLSMEAMIPLMDVAAANNMDLERTSLLVGRAISGEASALSRYGIMLDASAGPQEVLNALMQKFGGQAEANADPLVQLQNRLGDLMQVLGDALLPTFLSVLTKMELLVRGWIEFADANPGLSRAIMLVVAAMGAMLAVLGPMLLLLPQLVAGIRMVGMAMAALGVSGGPVLMAVAAIAAVVIALQNFLRTNNEVIIQAGGELDMARKRQERYNDLRQQIAATGLETGKYIEAYNKLIEAGFSHQKAMEKEIQMMESDLSGALEQTVRGTEEVSSGYEEISKQLGIVSSSSENTAQVFVTSIREQISILDEFGGVIEDSVDNSIAAKMRERDALVEATRDGLAESARMREQAAVAEINEAERVADAKEAAIQRVTDAQEAAHERQQTSWDRFLESQNPIMLKLDENNLRFKDVVELMAQESGKSLMQMGLDVQAAGITWGDTFELINSEVASNLGEILSNIKSTGAEAAATAVNLPVVAAESLGTGAGQPGAHFSGGSVSADQIDRAVEQFNTKMSHAPLSENEMKTIASVQAHGGDLADLGGRYEEIMRGIGLADGGFIRRGGTALVGERGPEVVSLPTGSTVHPNGTGPGGGVTNQFHFHGAGYGVEDLKEAVVEAVRDHAISGGFSGVFAEA